MPNLLSIPRELRDDIYKWLLTGPLQSSTSSGRARKRISKQAARDGDDDPMAIGITQSVSNSIHDSTNDAGSTKDPSIPAPTSAPAPGATGPSSANDPSSTVTGTTDYYDGEESIRYPPTVPKPPTHSLLHTSRQLRTELHEAVHRTRLRYRIRLAFRDDTETIYPTWLSVPALSSHIDVLDVDIRIRGGRTTSIFSVFAGDDDNEREKEGDVFNGGLVLLRRFLERGVDFLAKKKEKGREVRVGLLVINVVPKDVEALGRSSEEQFQEIAEWVDEWLTGEGIGFSEPRDREVERVDFFAERIERLEFKMGESRREWDLKSVVAGRERRMREEQEGQKQQQQQEEEEGEDF